jgi:hypothetical protein
MVAADMLFAGSIPEIYDRLLVPLIFESYARDLAERLAKVKPRDVLETAAGTGALPGQSRRGFPRTRALWQPISTRRCSIMPRQNSLAIIGSLGSRPMR